MWVVYCLLAVLGLLLLVLLVPVYGRATYDGDDLRVRLRVLGVPVTLLPAAEKEPSTLVKKKKTKKAAEKKPEKPSRLQEIQALLRQDDLGSTLTFLKSLAGLAGRTVGKALSAVTVDCLNLELLLATGDPADTATLYGKVCGVLYPSLTAVERVIRVRRRHIRVEPNFLLEQGGVRFDLRVHLSVLKLLGAGLYLLWNFLLMKETLSESTTKEELGYGK